MGVYMIESDFRAIGLSMGAREVALGDAWLQFASYDGSAADFFKSHREDRPHWFNVAGADDSANPALFSLKAQGEFYKEHGHAETVALAWEWCRTEWGAVIESDWLTPDVQGLSTGIRGGSSDGSSPPRSHTSRTES